MHAHDIESRVCVEDIGIHEIVYNNVGTGLELADGSEDWSGIALPPQTDAWKGQSLVYKASEKDRVPFGGREDGSQIKPLTIEESPDGITAPPSISHKDVVGIPDTTHGDAPSSPGRVVQEGYINATTEFCRDNDNFLLVGVADFLPREINDGDVTGFDEKIRVTVDFGLF